MRNKTNKIELPIFVTKDDLQYVGHTKYGDEYGDEDEQGVEKTVIVLGSDEYFFNKMVLRSVLKLWDAELEKEEEFYEVIDDKEVFEYFCYTSIPWHEYMAYFCPNEEALSA